MKKLFAAILTITMVAVMTNAKAETKLSKAIFAGGCFWCMEKPFDHLEGVVDVYSGYSGGQSENPTYKEVSSGRSGHVEVVQVTYDPDVVSYEQLLEVYWVNIDPTVKNRQFCDVGPQYRSEIFVNNDAERKAAEKSKQNLINKGFTVTTQITKAGPFYAAEEYHQNYYQKNPVRYKYYRYSCGRDNRLDDLWGKKRLYPKG